MQSLILIGGSDLVDETLDEYAEVYHALQYQPSVISSYRMDLFVAGDIWSLYVTYALK